MVQLDAVIVRGHCLRYEPGFVTGYVTRIVLSGIVSIPLKSTVFAKVV